MTGFTRRPLALLVYCLCASLGTARAADEETTTAAGGDAEAPVKLRVERKFSIQAKKKQTPFTVGLPRQLELSKDDGYPLFLIADHVVGRTDEITEADGKVELRRADALLFADHVTYWPLKDEVEAEGNVRLLQAGAEIETPRLRMKMSEQLGFAEDADYRIVRKVESRFYLPQQIAITNASIGASSTSGAPMALNIASSYGLPTTTPPTRDSEANGHAERIDFEGENQYRFFRSTFSSCKPADRQWYLKAAETHLDYDNELATARDASVWFKDVPIFWAPKASFSLNSRRTSGFLHPTYSFSSRNGFDLTAPYYWNIAPNYDVTFYPRYMAKRGVQLGADARYIDFNYTGNVKIEYLPEDEVLGRKRYAYQIIHAHSLGQGVTTSIQYNKVSDDFYWQDLSSRLISTSRAQLPQLFSLAFAPTSWLSTGVQVLRYQTLQFDKTQTIERPYFLEPQISVLGYKANVFKTDISVLGQYSRFTHPTKDQGDRIVFNPQVSLPIVGPAYQITAKLGMHMTKYNLTRQETAGENTISRNLPIFSLDGNLVFERDTSMFGKDYIQTLEPRLYYVHIPYRDQSNIPIFDTGLTDFNVAQIFAENRYSGSDRINDANQLTAALTSRMLDSETGVERLKAMVGQRYYFGEQRVSIPGETVRNENFSNVIAALTGIVLPKTYAEATWEYDYRNNHSVRYSTGVRYQPDYSKVLSASYRYTRDPLTNQAAVDQLDFSGQWPISGRWYAVGRYNYSLKDNVPLETIAGVEYNAGCWAARAVVQRLEAISGSPNTTLFFQLELNDFASIGSNPLDLLRRTIPGYGKSNEMPVSSSQMLNP